MLCPPRATPPGPLHHPHKRRETTRETTRDTTAPLRREAAKPTPALELSQLEARPCPPARSRTLRTPPPRSSLRPAFPKAGCSRWPADLRTVSGEGTRKPLAASTHTTLFRLCERLAVNALRRCVAPYRPSYHTASAFVHTCVAFVHPCVCVCVCRQGQGRQVLARSRQPAVSLLQADRDGQRWNPVLPRHVPQGCPG